MDDAARILAYLVVFVVLLAVLAKVLDVAL